MTLKTSPLLADMEATNNLRSSSSSHSARHLLGKNKQLSHRSLMKGNSVNPNNNNNNTHKNSYAMKVLGFCLLAMAAFALVTHQSSSNAQSRNHTQFLAQVQDEEFLTDNLVKQLAIQNQLQKEELALLRQEVERQQAEEQAHRATYQLKRQAALEQQQQNQQNQNNQLELKELQEQVEQEEAQAQATANNKEQQNQQQASLLTQQPQQALDDYDHELERLVRLINRSGETIHVYWIPPDDQYQGEWIWMNELNDKTDFYLHAQPGHSFGILADIDGQLHAKPSLGFTATDQEGQTVLVHRTWQVDRVLTSGELIAEQEASLQAQQQQQEPRSMRLRGGSNNNPSDE